MIIIIKTLSFLKTSENGCVGSLVPMRNPNASHCKPIFRMILLEELDDMLQLNIWLEW